MIIMDYRRSGLETLEVARKAVEIASSKQATDIVLLDMQGLCSFADYFVICSGESERQIKTICEEIGHTLKQNGVLPHHIEGQTDTGWLLIDFGDVIVHVFTPLERQHYQLEELWHQANTLVRIQ
ncbi:MAG: ribosome silencing factor [Dehalococcoidales bacterium]|nr:ribosome silencing factor [Dehalococcoidales bacterium]